MLRPRIIPCLLLREKGLVKTVGFSEPKYVGDPINVVRIFNEKVVDELIILDIDASVAGHAPDLELITQLAAESRMPICYGGGVTTVEQARTIIGLGVEKVALSSAAIANPALVGEIAASVGSQSVVAVLDVRQLKNGRDYEVWTHNGTRNTGRGVFELAREMEQRGVGEIVVNSIDRDGRMKGYDLELARRMRDTVGVPLTLVGGAGSVDDIGDLIREAPLIGAGAGSLFVFRGQYRAVLVNYPSLEARARLFADAASSFAGEAHG